MFANKQVKKITGTILSILGLLTVTSSSDSFIAQMLVVLAGIVFLLIGVSLLGGFKEED